MVNISEEGLRVAVLDSMLQRDEAALRSVEDDIGRLLGQVYLLSERGERLREQITAAKRLLGAA